MTRRHRTLGAALAALLLAWFTLGVVVTPAHAASGDSIDSYSATYTVNTDGSLSVDESFVYRFGSGSGRHGMIRYLTSREPYGPDPSKDRVYDITGVQVSSPDAGVSTEVQRTTVDASGGSKGRDQQVKLQIGSASQTVSAPSATYRIQYKVSRAIINDEHGDQLYWDPITGAMPPVQTATVTVTTPTTISQTKCAAAAQGATNATGGCDVSGTGTTQTLTATNVGDGKGMSFATIFATGAVHPNTPDLIAKGAPQVTSDKAALWAGLGGATLATTIGSIVAAVFYRRRSVDERYLGVPPGLTPGRGAEQNVGRDTHPQIPVQFNPPPISVGEAGMLDDGSVDVRDTTATLMDLAVRGFVKIAQNDDEETVVRAVTDQAPPLRHEHDLMTAIFRGRPWPGQEVVLGAAEMSEAHSRVTRDLTAAMSARGWYKRMPHALAKFNAGGIARFVWPLAFMVFMAGGVGGLLTVGVYLLPVLPLVILLMWFLRRRGVGQRSAAGRAMADQVEGFRRYIATAEADQIRFEEGEDIFSRYLPWAIMYGLTERWTKVCQQLVRMGRIPDVAPDWYVGYWPGFYYFDVAGLGHSMNDAFSPAASSGSGMSSFGSGSGSGFSGFGSINIGGGGGGGGADSW